ncbi:MAG TPA: hypothetical protein VNK03_06020 [Gammaproteobacteria bacterium]|nr:hypothetical protein [Gammaproteobacteria bacterium]
MIDYRLNHCVSTDRAWLEVRQKVKIRGASYHEEMDVPQQTANDWLNQRSRPPLLMLIKTEINYDVSIEKLAYFTPAEIKVLREWQQNANRLHAEDIDLNKIIIEDTKAHIGSDDDRIITDNFNVLVSGFKKVAALKADNKNKVWAITLDLESVLFGMSSAAKLHANLSLSEIIALGNRLERFVRNLEDEFTVLSTKTDPQDPKKDDYKAFIRSKWNEVSGRTDTRIAKTLGFSHGTYVRAKSVCQQAIPELKAAFSAKKISIAEAAEIARLSKAEQLKWCKSHLCQDSQNSFPVRQALQLSSAAPKKRQSCKNLPSRMRLIDV